MASNMNNNQVSFKIQFGDEIRRIALANRPSFEELRALIVKLFAARQLDESFVLKYVDEEADHVTLGSDMELECAVNALATGNRTLRLIVSVPAAARPNPRRWFHNHIRVQHPQPAQQPQQPTQPAQQPQQPQQPALEAVTQQIFDFLKTWGCPASEKTYQLLVNKINEFVKRVPDFKSVDQFITEAIAEAEKLLDNEDLKALLPIPFTSESLREFIAPFLENPFVQQAVNAFYENVKRIAQQLNQSAPAPQQPQPQPAHPHAHQHPCPRFRHPFFNPGNGNPNEEIHFGVVCDGCQSFPLRGVRHRCTQCPDYDLCQSCLDKGIHKDTTHIFTVVPPHPRPQVPFGFPGGRCGRRRGVFFQQQQQQQQQQPAAEQQPPVKEEVAAPAPEVAKEEPQPVPVKVEEPQPQPQEVITPEETVGLEKLSSMGFVNREANLAALRAANGDLWEALQIVLQQ